MIPAANYFGPLDVPVVVNDGEGDSNPFEVDVDVTAVNDLPVINTVPTGLSVAEDSPLAIAAADFDIIDPDDNVFTVVVQPGAN